MKCEEIFHNLFLNKYINKIEIKNYGAQSIGNPSGFQVQK